MEKEYKSADAAIQKQLRDKHEGLDRQTDRQ